MKKAVGWLVSWTFYWLGDFVSYPMTQWDWSRLFPLYSWLMDISSDVQEWGGAGAWHSIAKD